MFEKVIKAYNEAIIDTDREQALAVIEAARKNGMSPEDVVFHVVIPAIEQMIQGITENFESNLAQHFIAAQIASEVTEQMIKLFPAPPQLIGKVVIGSAEGDLHSLGKRIVSGCLRAKMIEVVDIGVNVSPERFVHEAVAQQADIIGISAMMVHTARGKNGCLKVRHLLHERGLEHRIKIVVGGAPFGFDANLYKTIQADAWASNGLVAAQVICELIQRMKS